MYFESAVERIPTVLAVSAMSAGSLTRAAAASASAWSTAGCQHKEQMQKRLFGQSRRLASTSKAVEAPEANISDALDWLLQAHVSFAAALHLIVIAKYQHAMQ